MTLNYIEHFLNLVFGVRVYISISDFASLIDISKGNMSCTIELNICEIIARIKKYESIIKKKKKHNEIALLAKTKINFIKDLISISLTHSYIECNYFNLTLIWLGFLGVHLEVEGGDKITPYLRLVRIMLET